MSSISSSFTRVSSYSAAVAALENSLLGQLVKPGDSEYDEARGVWNAAINRFPSLIVRVAGASDVRTAVRFAREHNLPVAVRSGGHGFAGQGTTDGGIVIDLSPMKGISIDPERRIARVEAGRTWGEVAQAAQEYGLAISSGDMHSVGVGGLALGGGIGWMVRKHGLTIDNLLSAEVVTADGQLLTASATQNAELFWGLRGGGGNFGIATSFEFALQPAGLILGGAVIYPIDDAEAILRSFASYAAAAPDELTAMATIMPAPPAPFIPPSAHGIPVVVILLCYAGDLEEGQRVVAPLRTLGTPIADIISPMPYPALFAITAEGAARGRQHISRSLFLKHIDDAVLHTIVTQAADLTSPNSMAQLRILGGAMSRVPVDATAFAHRDALAMFTIINSWSDPAEADRHQAWTTRFFRAMQPYAAGVYVNFLEDEGDKRIREAYSPETYERLVALKNRYDPENLFHLNQNIKPSADVSGELLTGEERVA